MLKQSSHDVQWERGSGSDFDSNATFRDKVSKDQDEGRQSGKSSNNWACAGIHVMAQRIPFETTLHGILETENRQHPLFRERAPDHRRHPLCCLRYLAKTHFSDERGVYRSCHCDRVSRKNAFLDHRNKKYPNFEAHII